MGLRRGDAVLEWGQREELDDSLGGSRGDTNDLMFPWITLRVRARAVQAKNAGIDEAHDAINESSKDEARHAEALKGLLTRYFYFVNFLSLKILYINILT